MGNLALLVLLVYLLFGLLLDILVILTIIFLRKEELEYWKQTRKPSYIDYVLTWTAAVVAWPIFIMLCFYFLWDERKLKKREKMKITKTYDEKKEHHIITADDESMIKFLRKLSELAFTSRTKIYWRSINNYRFDHEQYYIYCLFPTLGHDITLANECEEKGWERRIWLHHYFQKRIGEDVKCIEVISPVQMECFDLTFKVLKDAGVDVTLSDAALIKDILRL
jgi:hypothetical protein